MFNDKVIIKTTKRVKIGNKRKEKWSGRVSNKDVMKMTDFKSVVPLYDEEFNFCSFNKIDDLMAANIVLGAESDLANGFVPINIKHESDLITYYLPENQLKKFLQHALRNLNN
jgi:hypothetical protein